MTFFSRLFASKEAAPSPSVPLGQRVYAIGDIHGRDDLFSKLIAKIDADSAARGEADVMLILLGDLIDRGPDSRNVVERAIRLKAQREVRTVKGNHEEVLIAALKGDDHSLGLLLKFGGDATLVSYGLSGMEVASLDVGSLLWRLSSAMPQDHFDFFDTMEDQIQVGDYLFVHAGIRPGVAFHLQRGNDLRWIRDEFLNHSGYHGAMVVHGHSIAPQAEMLPNRLGIDTGAYSSGMLTAIGLEGTDRWLLQT